MAATIIHVQTYLHMRSDQSLCINRGGYYGSLRLSKINYLTQLHKKMITKGASLSVTVN